ARTSSFACLRSCSRFTTTSSHMARGPRRRAGRRSVRTAGPFLTRWAQPCPRTGCALAAPRAAYTCAMDSNPRKGPIAEELTLAPIAGASPARRLPRLHGKLPFRLRPLSRLGGDALPHAGQRFESANIRLAIARLPLLDHPLELRHERGAEHVENLMSR